MPTSTPHNARALVTDQMSLRCGLLRIGIATRRRATKLNECEHSRLDVQMRSIDKNARMAENRQNRVIGRLNKTLKELSAYHQVLNDSFKVDHFDTLQFGYKAKEARKDPRRLQRFAYETKIYHSGFSVRNLRREVQAKLQELDPEFQKAEAKKNRIEALKARNKVVTIHRKMPLSAILRQFNDQKYGKTVHVPETKAGEASRAGSYFSGSHEPRSSLHSQISDNTSQQLQDLGGE